MIRRYFGWRAGALVVGCALGALLASAPAQAQCVGDCNDDGMVAINELITGVNIALGSANVSAVRRSTSNDDGEVAINELITAVNNALSSCPAVNTPTNTVPANTPTDTVMPISTPTDTFAPTNTPTLMAGTATATITETPQVVDTPTPTATEAPTVEPIGKSLCTIGTGSQLLLQTVALPLSLAPTGTVVDRLRRARRRRNRRLRLRAGSVGRRSSSPPSATCASTPPAGCRDRARSTATAARRSTST